MVKYDAGIVIDDSWFNEQKQEPFCEKMVIYVNLYIDRYHFDFGDCLLTQSLHISPAPVVRIVDKKSDECLAMSDDVGIGDVFDLGERMLENSHGNGNVPKRKVDAIIWKLMTGDMKLVGMQ